MDVTWFEDSKERKFCYIAELDNYTTSCLADQYTDIDPIRDAFKNKTHIIEYIDFKISDSVIFSDLVDFLENVVYRINNDGLWFHISNQANPNFNQTSLYELPVFYEIWEYLEENVIGVNNIDIQCKEQEGKGTLDNEDFKKWLQRVKDSRLHSNIDDTSFSPSGIPTLTATYNFSR